MDPLVLVLLLASALLIGILIGSVGVGGFLLAPALLYIAGFNLHLAMATSLWSFVLPGIVGTAAFSRRGTLDWGVGRGAQPRHCPRCAARGLGQRRSLAGGAQADPRAHRRLRRAPRAPRVGG